MQRPHIHVAVDVEMLEVLDAMAKLDHTTRSAVVRDILEENLIGMGYLEGVDYGDSEDDEWADEGSWNGAYFTDGMGEEHHVANMEPGNSDY